MEKLDGHSLFRLRLQETITIVGISKSQLGRATNVDRSTIGQLFKSDRPRMPNAQLAECHLPSLQNLLRMVSIRDLTYNQYNIRMLM